MRAENDRRLGKYVATRWGGETVRAFVPPPLPPDPPLRLETLQRILEQANQALGRLDGLAIVWLSTKCVAALGLGLDRLRGGFPLSLRLIREIHAVLLSKGRGSEKQPGEFRTDRKSTRLNSSH